MDRTWHRADVATVMANFHTTPDGLPQEYVQPLGLEPFRFDNPHWDDILRVVPRVCVMRSGRSVRLRPEELSLGDLVCMKAGDCAVGDMRVVECDASTHIEYRMLTGDAMPVPATTEALQEDAIGRNMIVVGTYVTEGELKAVLVGVGRETLAAEILTQLQRDEPHSSLSWAQTEALRDMGVSLRAEALLETRNEKEIMKSLAAVDTVVIEASALTDGVVACGWVEATTEGPVDPAQWDTHPLLTAVALCHGPPSDDETGEPAGRWLQAAFERLYIETFGAVRYGQLMSIHPVIFHLLYNARDVGCCVRGKSGVTELFRHGNLSDCFQRCKQKMARDGTLSPLSAADQQLHRTLADQMHARGENVLGVMKRVLSSEHHPPGHDFRTDFPGLLHVDSSERAGDWMYLGLVRLKTGLRAGAQAALQRLRALEDIQIMIVSSRAPNALAPVIRECGLSVSDLTQEEFLAMARAHERDGGPPPPATVVECDRDNERRKQAIKAGCHFARMTALSVCRCVELLRGSHGGVPRHICYVGDRFLQSDSMRSAQVRMAFAEYGADAARRVANVLIRDLSCIPSAVEYGRKWSEGKGGCRIC